MSDFQWSRQPNQIIPPIPDYGTSLLLPAVKSQPIPWQQERKRPKILPKKREKRWVLLYHNGRFAMPLHPGQTIIGSGKDADFIVCKDNSVSRRHACLTLDANGVVLEDLHSLNKVWLNGQAITQPVRLAEKMLFVLSGNHCFSVERI